MRSLQVIARIVFFIITLIKINIIYADQNVVGSINGSFQVTNLGQSKYSIPIEFPPGTAKMVPSLSIVYDSLNSNHVSSNGLLGVGFKLDGLSVITKRSLFYLNGEQLVNIKREEYRTYIDSNSKIISYGKNVV